MTTKGIYNTLVTQLDKLARHNRQGSFRTKDRYYEAVKRFCAYLAAHYHLQKLENIVPIKDDRITMMLQRLLEETERGHKLLVPDDIPTDRAINDMQQFIIRHRDTICDPTAPDRRITFHGLRHTYAVAAIRAGDDIKTAQGNLGHATAAFTLDMYGHVTDQMKRESADRMERFIRTVSAG